MSDYSYIYGQRRALPADPAFKSYLRPATSAVISIDMHEGHLADSPDCPCPAPRACEMAAPIDAFHTHARALGVLVIHVHTELRADGSDDVRGGMAAWRLVFPLHVGAIPNAAEHALEGSRWTRPVTRVEAADRIVKKQKRLSIFYPTDLDSLLRNLNVRTVLLNGGFTDCCVHNAAFDASNHDYRVVVLRDLVRGTNPEMEEAALKMVSLHMGLVMDAGDLLDSWAARPFNPASC